MVHVHKYKKNQRQIISVLAVKSWKMNNSDDTVDAATQCGEETEASTQTEEMMNSLSQTVDMAGHEEEEVEEIGRDEGSQTMLPDSATLTLAILANRSAYHLHHAIGSKPLSSRTITIPGCCTVSTPS